MRDTLRFVLNGEAVALRDVDPRTTLLDWLRETRRLTGTKEGCNEGDCGACTVGVTRLEDGVPRRRAVNACIQLLPMLDGAAVTTVEALAGPERLHPAQQAMVDLHGSQCGFCTPGFVMSLWSAYPDGPQPRRSIEDALAGNLCRCTGYGPILESGERMHDLPAPDWEADPAPALAELSDFDGLTLTAAGCTAHVPAAEDDLAALVEANPEAVIVAGATDVGLWITKRLMEPKTLIFVNRVRDFDRVVETPDHIELGAGATYARAAEALASLSPDLGEMVRRLGSTQVRNSGCVGANIANGSPIGDGPPPLIALGAQLVLRKGEAVRTIPLESFFLDYGKQDRAPGEYVSAMRIPRPKSPESLKVYKISKRFDQDITATLGAFLIEVSEGTVASASIVYGGMAGTPKRARAVEAALVGKPWTRETVEAALPAYAEDFQPMSDMRASAEYRLRAAQNLLLKVFHETTEGTGKSRLVGAGALA
ncbi:xanthine dehydrogenase small subunit [Albimonas sp. CAU 1670]|uniref:xanthine dehydrogenase small subunit n=1 Tax=Albimonas sp. CAU 1670 TaxID=3032599 RepID=UPI0023DC2B9D|nr:xanthine dehydrogenase small subunit [Albimonas sp. CAU 1670]MDF2232756.1 xanthine dehydrogenase small subunit [Albimonas sp. CAU 1670]